MISPWWIFKFLACFLLTYLFAVYFVKPYIRLRLYKWAHGDKVEIYFYPFIGIFSFFYAINLGRKQYIQDNLDYTADTLYKGYLKRNPNMQVLITNIGQKLYFFLSEPELIRKLSIEQYHLYTKWIDIPFADLFVEKGLFATSGELWKRQRTFLAPLFTFEALRERVPAMTRAAQELVEALHTSKDARQNLLPSLTKCTGDIICRTFFGEEVVKAVILGRSITETIQDIVNEATVLPLEDFVTQLRGFLLRTYRHADTPFWLYSSREKALYKKIMAIRSYVLQVIKERKAHFNEKENKMNDFLQVHIREMLNNQQTQLTDEEVLQQFLSIYQAGQDTTARTLLISLYYLAQNQELQNSLRAEIKEKVGENYQKIQKITFEQAKSLDNMAAFLNEVLRCKSPIPSLLPRIAQYPHELGYLSIQKGDMVDANLLGNMTREKYFANAEKFDINRWKDAATKQLNPHIYTPFHSGPRNCIGQHLSLLETKIILCHLLTRFTVLPRKDFQLKMVIKIFYEPQDDYIVELQELQEP